MADDFLWYQRRAIILLSLSIFAYGLFEEPKLLWMTPVLVLASLFAITGILRDKPSQP